MGLTMVRDLCRAHGGEASVCVRADIRGATIRVEFRRKQTRATRSQRP
jgi:signal transduction histidine kinase